MDTLLLFLIFITICIAVFMNWWVWYVNQKPKLQVEPFAPHPDNHLTPFTYEDQKEIFVTFPCGNCTEQIVVEESLMPGDIHVVDCQNCKTSWSIYNPSLVIKQTKDLPDALKTAVAQNMAELNA